MRYLFFILLLFFACAPQKKIPKLDYPVPFQFELIDTLAGSKDELYVKAHQWIAKTFDSAKTVIDMQDKEAGKLICKPLFTIPRVHTTLYYSFPYEDVITYVVSIDVKDGRYRCIISDFVHKGGNYFDGKTTTESTSYGSLEDTMRLYRSPATGKMTENRYYYAVKNAAMQQAKDLIKDLKTKMHDKDKDF